MHGSNACPTRSVLTRAADGEPSEGQALNCADDRLREAIEAMPHGVVLLDSEGRYTLWNSKYAEIYHKSADLFAPGVKLAETLRCGVERGD